MPVLVYADDDAAAEVGFDQRHVHIVTERGAKIVHRAQFANDSFIPAIEQALAK